MKKFFKRLKYWLTHDHKETCRRCCLFCKHYEICKDEGDYLQEAAKE